MNGFLRRLRGVIKTGLTWAIAWGGLWGAFLVVVVLVGLVKGDTSLLGWADLWGMSKMVLSVARDGFLAGSTFGVVLSVLERHKSLEQISYKAAALGGALGGVAIVGLFSVLFGTYVLTQLHWSTFLVTGGLSMGSAAGTVALAKRADRKLIEGEDEPLPSLEWDLEPERIG